MTENTQKAHKPSLRTYRQNRALHKYLRNLAYELNEEGYSVKIVLAKKMDIDWTPKLAKELLWRPAQKAITGKKSSKELRKSEEIDLIYNHLARHMGEKFGIYLDWPHYETEQDYIKATTETSLERFV